MCSRGSYLQCCVATFCTVYENEALNVQNTTLLKHAKNHINPLMDTGNYSATSNSMKLVHNTDR